MQKVKILVTGGAGYIGSHFVKNCYEQDKFQVDILVYDDLSNGYKENVLYGKLVVASLDDKKCVKQTIKEFQPDVIVHFAAFIQVGESAENPFKYYKNNTENTLYLLRLVEEFEVKHFIFSSTAAVYGQPENNEPILETAPYAPINVYGDSKSMVDKILKASQSRIPFRFITFRYFNVAGADPQARLGQRTKNASHLIARALEVATGKREFLPIYGDDYDTPDGTGVRDYIHVEDLVNAHIQGLEYLLAGGKSEIYNLGYGSGYSVQNVVDIVRKVTGKDIPIKIEPRREGDPALLVANSTKAQQNLGWKAEYNDLNTIIQHAYNFELTDK